MLLEERYCIISLAFTMLLFYHSMQVKSVFLDGLPPHWDEDKVREMFGKFGEIDNIHLARNMFTAKRKDFGFIGFTTRKSALDCIKMVNKEGVGEGSGKVTTLACYFLSGTISCHLIQMYVITCSNFSGSDKS